LRKPSLVSTCDSLRTLFHRLEKFLVIHFLEPGLHTVGDTPEEVVCPQRNIMLFSPLKNCVHDFIVDLALFGFHAGPLHRIFCHCRIEIRQEFLSVLSGILGGHGTVAKPVADRRSEPEFMTEVFYRDPVSGPGLNDQLSFPVAIDIVLDPRVLCYGIQRSDQHQSQQEKGVQKFYNGQIQVFHFNCGVVSWVPYASKALKGKGISRPRPQALHEKRKNHSCWESWRQIKPLGILGHTQQFSNVMEINYQRIYEHAGYLFYAIAAADGAVKDAEVAVFKDLVSKEW